MTHNDIYTKFLIEYDKANVTSSYPALTKYEAATLLDRAYLALIARKVTGNNPRRASLEYDIKAIEDLRPLMVTKALSPTTSIGTADNEFVYKLPKKTEMLYFIEGFVDYENTVNAADGMKHKTEIANLADHRTAQKFIATNSNMPWIKQPLVFLEGEDAHLLIDTYKHKNDKLSFYATYLKLFAKFAIGVPELTTPTEEEPTPTQEEPTPTPTPSDPTVEPDPIVDPEPTQEEPTVEPQPTLEEPTVDPTPTPTPVTPTPTTPTEEEESLSEKYPRKYESEEYWLRDHDGFYAKPGIVFEKVGDSYDISWCFNESSVINKLPAGYNVVLEIQFKKTTLRLSIYTHTEWYYKYITVGNNIEYGTTTIDTNMYEYCNGFSIIVESGGNPYMKSNMYQPVDTLNNVNEFTYAVEFEFDKQDPIAVAPKNLDYVLIYSTYSTQLGLYSYRPSKILKAGVSRTVSLCDGYEYISVDHLFDVYPRALITWSDGKTGYTHMVRKTDANPIKIKVVI